MGGSSFSRVSDAQQHAQSHVPGREWLHMRKQLKDRSLERCYRRYRERLAVVNVSLFIFVMEVTLGFHLLIQICQEASSIEISLPLVSLMLLLPAVLLVCFSDPQRVRKFRVWNILASCVAAGLITISDTFLVLMVSNKSIHLRGSYDHVLIFSVYILLPVSIYGIPTVLAATISIVYLVYNLISTYDNYGKLYAIKQGGYVVYLITLNLFSQYIQIFLEYHLREMILSRYKLLYQNLQLKTIVQEEFDLLKKIMPVDISDQIVQKLKTHIKHQSLGIRYTEPSVLYVELFSDVSILVAQFVDYTMLTTQMELAQIITTLHEIFVHFDQAAAKYNVHPIKFLGNMYTCLAGIMEDSQRHSNSCIDLCLDMISFMDALSRSFDLDLGMRMAVHDGEIYAAIVGRIKCQLDMWSLDMAIAYRLELLGAKRKVHISQRTLISLHGEYRYEDGSEEARVDDFLVKANISTYFIGPQQLPGKTKHMDIDGKNLSTTDTSLSEAEVETIQQKILRTFKEKVELMPVDSIHLGSIFDFSNRVHRGNEDYIIKPHITPVFRQFCNIKLENDYIHVQDVFFKYNLLIMVGYGIAMVIKSIMPPLRLRVTYKLVGLCVVLIIACLLSFYSKLSKLASKTPETYEPKCGLHRFLYYLSIYPEVIPFFRLLSYVVFTYILFVMARLYSIDVRIETLKKGEHYADDREKLDLMEDLDSANNMVLLFIIMFTFTMRLLIKVILLSTVMLLHLLTLASYSKGVTLRKTHDMGIRAGFIDMWYMGTFLILFLITDHHIIYLRRVSYYFKHSLHEKIELTKKSKRHAKLILGSILPGHLVKLFINRTPRDELYYESYNKVAILFASIVNFPLDKTSLRVLNEYICYFDDLLEDYTHSFKIEKIKMVNWTYMLACGLKPDPYINRYAKDRGSFKETDVNTATARQIYNPVFKPRFLHPQIESQDYCLVYLAQYASDMLRIMQNAAMLNRTLSYDNALPGELKVGISYGPVLTGVVGQLRPLYDIWGKTVNRAWTMSDRGIVDHIQVNDITAETLRRLDIRCVYRGMQPVEGEETVKAYLIDLDNQHNFQRLDEGDLDLLEYETDSKLVQFEDHKESTS